MKKKHWKSLLESSIEECAMWRDRYEAEIKSKETWREVACCYRAQLEHNGLTPRDDWDDSEI